MTADDRHARAAERIAGALVESGLARMPARVYAAAMVDDDGRITAAELADFLGVSSGSVSGAVRTLSQIGFIRRERERGSRRDVFVVEDDAWHEAMTRREQSYAPIKSALATASDVLGPDDPATRRLRLAHEFLAFVEREMGAILERWDAHKRELGYE